MKKIILTSMIISILPGCSDTTPINITAQHKKFVGVWQLRYEDIRENSTKIDNMLLVVNPDATAALRKCKIIKKKGEILNSSSRYSIHLQDATVTRITENTITIAQKVGWFGFDTDLTIDIAPYLENENWYVNVDGRKLARLTGEDIQSEINWDCPKSDDAET